MTSLLVLLLSPLLCQAASVYEQGKHLHQQDQWTVVDGSGGQVNTGCPPNRLGGPIDNCRLLRTIMDLLKVASTTYRCPTCLVPCSSDAAVCTAIGSFARKTAETHAL